MKPALTPMNFSFGCQFDSVTVNSTAVFARTAHSLGFNRNNGAKRQESPSIFKKTVRSFRTNSFVLNNRL